jgi:hypothetical protein
MNRKQFTLTAAAIACAGVTAQAAAISVDLIHNSSGTLNGATFVTTEIQPTGTGVIQPFSRLQGNGTAEGYNSDSASLMPDEKAGTWTHDLKLSTMGTVTMGGAQYYEFLLDINQTGTVPSYLSLDQIGIYQRSSALSPANTLSALTGSSTLVYSLDASNPNNEILLDYNKNSGSGSGDMFAYIPASVFNSANGDFVYLYSHFGGKGGDYAENDGFEEWAVRQGTSTQVPDGGATVALLGAGLLGLGAMRRKLS